MKYLKDELKLIWVDSFVNLDYGIKSAIYEKVKEYSSIKDGLEENREYLISRVCEESFSELLNSANQVYLQYVLDNLQTKNITCVTIDSERYPIKLLETDAPPLVLYAKGDISLLEGDLFSIVGSRKSLPISINLTKDITSALCEANVTLVTGIAEGIDETVIKTTLERNGKIISVIAGGFDHVYPSTNQKLIEEIELKGLAISEYPPSVKPMPYFFPIRNRIIAGLSKGVLVTSGGLKSGTMYTAEYAGEYGRDLFAVPYSVGVKSGEGCNELIKRGAILVDSPKDLLEYYGYQIKEKDIETNQDEKEIIEILSEGEMHIEKIAERSGKPLSKLLSILSILEIKGLVVKNGANVYARSL